MAENVFAFCGREYRIPPMNADTFRQIKRLTGRKPAELIQSGRKTDFLVSLIAVATGTSMAEATALCTDHLDAGGNFDAICVQFGAALDRRRAWLEHKNGAVKGKYRRVV